MENNYFENIYSNKLNQEFKKLDPADEEVFVKIVDLIFQNTIFFKASDIYFEPLQNSLKVKYKIDGIIYPALILSENFKEPVITRIKVISNLVIYKKRKPQEGRIIAANKIKNVDMRISIIPTLHGEKLAIRILYSNELILPIEKLGLTDAELKLLKKITTLPQGLILFTGPAGSGKSTSIYSILKYIQKTKGEYDNICTLEDPVEIDLEDIPQTNIDESIGFTYEKGLKSVLRQDPNVIMLGEIRDKDTAKITIEASLTGHLIISTIHSKSVAGVIIRILNMDIEPYLAASSISAIISQRLLRKLCPDCKMKNSNNKKIYVNNKKIQTSYVPVGCPKCRMTGYQGRTAVFEILEINKSIADLIIEKPSLNKLENRLNLCKTPIVDNAISKVESGEVSLEEIFRVFNSNIEF